MRLNTKINEEASGRGLFFVRYLGLFLRTVFLVVSFYERAGIDVSGCSVFGGE